LLREVNVDLWRQIKPNLPENTSKKSHNLDDFWGSVERDLATLLAQKLSSEIGLVK